MKCSLILDSEQPFIAHFEQAFGGFHALASSGMFQLDVTQEKLNLPPACFAVQLGKKRIIYDLADGLQNLRSFDITKLNNDYVCIFKRAYDPLLYRDVKNVHPYGFNYQPRHCLINRLPFMKPYKYPFCNIPYWYNMRGMFPRSNCSNGKVLLFTRLWDKSQTSSDNLDKLNEFRISSVRLLRKVFGTAAYAGVYDSPIARKLCPDLILPYFQVRRNHFLTLMHNASVCVSTTGLWNSTGWRFGEYVAAGKAIVSEKLFFSVPGDFAEGRNYLEFSTSEKLLSNCEFLLHNANAREELEWNNFCYYESFLRPDVLVMNSLNIALNGSDS